MSLLMPFVLVTRPGAAPHWRFKIDIIPKVSLVLLLLALEVLLLLLCCCCAAALLSLLLRGVRVARYQVPGYQET